MSQKLNLSHVVLIIGQSGCGKGTLVSFLKEFAQLHGKQLCIVSCGDCVRKAADLGTHIAEKMKKINNQGKRQPGFIVTGFIFNELLTSLKEDQYAIIEGMPRDPNQFRDMYRLLKIGYFKSMQVVEILANNRLCYKRLAKRARQEKREDLCVDGQPGVPDINKIKTKMDWWDKSKGKIIQAVMDNKGTLDEFRDNLRALFISNN